MVAVLLAFAASACWGVADFGGGLFSRRWPALSVLLVVEVGGLVAATVIVLVAGDALPDGEHVALAGLAGLTGGVGLALFYTALSAGTMSVVAPISATGAVLPVAVGVATGDALTLLIGAGLVLTLTGVVFASREAPGEDDGPASRRSILLAVGAAVGFGAFFALYDVAADDSVAWAILIARLPPAVLVGLLVRRSGLRVPHGPDLRRLLVVAQLDCVATSLYAVAITRGELSIVAVVGSLYPVTTVLLARAVLHERLQRIQAAGVAVALLGVALVSLGSA